MQIKNFIKKTFNLFGFEIHRLQPSSDSISQIIAAMNIINTDMVFDIGSNEGQFAEVLRRKGYRGKIVSFEPINDARKILIKNASKDDNWTVHERVAIGEKAGVVEINISKNSVSSSILPMLQSHSKVEDNSVYIGSERVPIISLDSIIRDYLSENSSCFLKIDTQGYEWQVLQGAKESLKLVNGIICEISLVSLYEGQVLYKDIINKLENEGFVLWSLIKGFMDKKSGRSLQMDAIFLKKDKIN